MGAGASSSAAGDAADGGGDAADGGAGAGGGGAPKSLKVQRKEARRMREQAKGVGISQDAYKLLLSAFGMLPSFDGSGSVRPEEVALLPQLAAVPLLGRVATLYTDAAGRFGMKELVNLVTEWSDPVEGQASGDGPRPLSKNERIRKVFDAFDGDRDGTITVPDLVQLIMALSCGTVDEPSLRRSLLRGPAAEGLSFERFSSMIYPEELLLKTTVRL